MKQSRLAHFFKSRMVSISLISFLFFSGVLAGTLSNHILPQELYGTLSDGFAAFFSEAGQIEFRTLFQQLFANQMQPLLWATLFTFTLTGVLFMPLLSVFTGFLYGLSLSIILGMFGGCGILFNTLYFLPRLLLFVPIVLLFYAQCFVLCITIALRIFNKTSVKGCFSMGSSCKNCAVLFALCLVGLILSSLAEAGMAPYVVFQIFGAQ